MLGTLPWQRNVTVKPQVEVAFASVEGSGRATLGPAHGPRELLTAGGCNSTGVGPAAGAAVGLASIGIKSISVMAFGAPPSSAAIAASAASRFFCCPACVRD